MPRLGLTRFSNRQPAKPKPSSSPRRSNRFSLPFGTSALMARLELTTVMPKLTLAGRFWDVSDHGGCLSMQPGTVLTLPAVGVLHLAEPTGEQRHQWPVELRWISSLSHSTFVGLRFAGGPQPSQTFLRDYMQSSWTDAVPGA